MFLIRMIRKVFSLFRSGLTAHEIALGACLGVLGGCIPFSSGWMVAAVVLLMVIFRSSFTAFLVAGAVVKLLAFAVEPVCYKLGQFALDGALSGFFATLANTPGLALLDFHRYVVTGGIIFALIVAIPAYPLLFVFTNRYRKALIGWSEKSPRYKAFTEKGPVRFLSWLFLGKKGDYAAALEGGKGLIRKGMVLGLAVFAVVVGLVTFFFGDALARTGFEAGMSAAFDAEVSLEEAGISFVGGSLEFGNMLMVERERKGDISRSRHMRGDLDAVELWRRRLVFDEIILEDVMFRAARDKEGNFNLEGKKKKKRGPRKKRDDEEGFAHLGDLWQKKDLGQDVVEILLDVIFPETDPEAVAAAREKELEELEKRTDYASIYADHLIADDKPLVVINVLDITGLNLVLDDPASGKEADRFGGLTLRATNLSSDPVLYATDSVIELFSFRTGSDGKRRPDCSIKLTLKWSMKEPVHTVEVTVNDISADKIVAHMNEGGKVKISKGAIRLDSRTELGPDQFKSETKILLKDLTLKPSKPGGKILGFDGAQFCKGLNEYLKVQPLELDVGLDGAYTSPKVHIDEEKLRKQVTAGLQGLVKKLAEEEIAAQKQKALEKVEEEKAELEGKLEEKKQEGKAKAEEKVKDGLNKLFGGDDDDDKKKKGGKKKKKKKNNN